MVLSRSGRPAGAADASRIAVPARDRANKLETAASGEVASNYAGPANSGDRVNRLELMLTPREDLSIGVQYWKFGRVGEAADLAGRELDVFAFWQINENLTFVPLIGLYKPTGADVKAAQGNDQQNLYLQAVMIWTY